MMPKVVSAEKIADKGTEKPYTAFSNRKGKTILPIPKTPFSAVLLGVLDEAIEREQRK